MKVSDVHTKAKYDGWYGLNYLISEEGSLCWVGEQYNTVDFGIYAGRELESALKHYGLGVRD